MEAHYTETWLISKADIVTMVTDSVIFLDVCDLIRALNLTLLEFSPSN